MVIGRLSIPGLTASPAPIAATPFVAPLAASLARATLATTQVSPASSLSSQLARPSVVATQATPSAAVAPGAIAPVGRLGIGVGGGDPAPSSALPLQLPTPGASPPPTSAALGPAVSAPLGASSQGVVRVIQPPPTDTGVSPPPVLTVDHPSVTDPAQVTPVATSLATLPPGVSPVSAVNTSSGAASSGVPTIAIVGGLAAVAVAAFLLLRKRR